MSELKAFCRDVFEQAVLCGFWLCVFVVYFAPYALAGAIIFLVGWHLRP